MGCLLQGRKRAPLADALVVTGRIVAYRTFHQRVLFKIFQRRTANQAFFVVHNMFFRQKYINYEFKFRMLEKEEKQVREEYSQPQQAAGALANSPSILEGELSRIGNDNTFAINGFFLRYI